MDTQSTPAHRVLLREGEVKRRCGGLTAKARWEMEAQGRFPKRVRLTDNGSQIAWFEDEIDAWISARIRAGGKRMPTGCRGVEDAAAQPVGENTEAAAREPVEQASPRRRRAAA